MGHFPRLPLGSANEVSSCITLALLSIVHESPNVTLIASALHGQTQTHTLFFCYGKKMF